MFKDGALKVLDGVGLTVERAGFREFGGEGIALLGQAAVPLPVGLERPTDGLAGCGEGMRIGLGLPRRDQRQAEEYE